MSDAATLYTNNPATELVLHVCQTAGVMLAMPMGVQLQGHGVNQQVALPITNVPQGKLLIPCLPHYNIQPTSKSSSPSAISSAASISPPSTPPLSATPPPQLIIESPTPSESDASSNASKLLVYTHTKYIVPSPPPAATINELSTLAMVLQGTGGIVSSIAHAKAHSIWDTTRSYTKHAKPGSHSKTKVSEKLVLAELDIAGAIDHLTMLSADVKGNNGYVYLPLEVLACSLVQEHIKEHLGVLFIEAVNPTREDGEEKNNDNEICRSINSAKELGGTVSKLRQLLECIWRTPSSVTPEDFALKGCDNEVRVLLTMLVLYKCIFANAPEESALLSPLSPKGKEEEGGMIFKLRHALGSQVFEDAMGGSVLEDARDRVVDLIVEFEMKGQALTV
ncbi:hypothetical protein BDQ12DRAFT_720318 [Crucibulum laeve]|uniref:Uncharacterized protein n=1 Tax=Crucibulum laeve TaxID=68775 RepID=A0A5C3M845_9AGAR|nr:hypothetical protein BDQ12DRAFT_720318 [Crucibulum laeve]